MAYTTFRENGPRPDDYDKLEVCIKMVGKGVPVYVLATSREDYPIETIREKMKDVNGIKHIRQVNGTIDLVVPGEDSYKDIATELFRRTRAPIGIVKYEEGQDIGNLYVNLRIALNMARKEGRMYHLYDPNKNPLQASVRYDLVEPSLK